MLCKPCKDGENDSFSISKGNVTDVEVADDVIFQKWELPVADDDDDNDDDNDDDDDDDE